MELLVIRPPADETQDDERLSAVLRDALSDLPHRTLTNMDDLPDLRGRRLLFAVALGQYGVNAAYLRLLRRLRAEPDILDGCTAALAVNMAGCALLGRPLVEATGSLVNFRVQAKLLDTDLAGAYRAAVRELAERLAGENFAPREKPSILALHASSYHTSNTMQLWGQVKTRLGGGFDVTEIGLRNGAVSDCAGCPYTACLHFGEKDRCFYGGLMQDEVWPAVRRCDAVVLLCPNYNDALSANLTAFINRLTGLFRQTRFYDKAVFAIVVSGYSGGDTVARQIVSAMNMNKSFYLPPCFAMIETANDPGEALRLSGIEARLDGFAARIRSVLLA